MIAFAQDAVWKPVTIGPLAGHGFEISSTGVARKTTEFSVSGRRTRELKPTVGSGGYLKIGTALKLADGRKAAKQIFIHVLVAEQFICPRPSGKFVNHINGNRIDNRVENLEWVTPSENQLHASALKPRKKWGRYSDADVRMMRKCAKIGLSLSEICKAFDRFNIQPYELSRILNGTRRTGAYLTMKHTLNPR